MNLGPATLGLALGLLFTATPLEAPGPPEKVPQEPAGPPGPWEVYAHALLLSNEFLFVD